MISISYPNHSRTETGLPPPEKELRSPWPCSVRQRASEVHTDSKSYRAPVFRVGMIYVSVSSSLVYTSFPPAFAIRGFPLCLVILPDTDTSRCYFLVPNILIEMFSVARENHCHALTDADVLVRKSFEHKRAQHSPILLSHQA